MKVLIADDEPVSRRLLSAELERWQFEVVAVTDGSSAWAVLEQPDHPPLVILDWMMPEVDGLELCRRLRKHEANATPTYVFLLTGRSEKADIVSGLEAGADDYLIKPFNSAELRARLQVGARLVSLQQSLAAQVHDLEEALRNVKQLQGLLPVCAWCKKVRNDQNYWQGVEEYMSSNMAVHFTHCICPDCLQKQIEQTKQMRGQA